MTVRVSGPGRRRDIPRIDRRLLRRRATRLLRDLTQEEAELSLRLATDDEIQELNGEYRDKPVPTDVLAFPLLEGRGVEFRGGLLGDVVISLETAAGQARRSRRSLDDQVLKLLIHGTLHLLGYDHERGEQDAREMAAEERRLWRLLQP